MAMEHNHEPHELRLDQRARLSVSGVREVESFDETAVVLNTVGGLLIVRGENLQLQALSIDGGQVTVHGRIDNLTYEELQKTGSFLKRLFR
jgi:sporulation protein YabP